MIENSHNVGIIVVVIGGGKDIVKCSAGGLAAIVVFAGSAGGNDGYADLILKAVVDLSTPDDVGVFIGCFGHNGRCMR